MFWRPALSVGPVRRDNCSHNGLTVRSSWSSRNISSQCSLASWSGRTFGAAQQRAANLALLRHEAILTTISAEVQGVAPDEEDDLVTGDAGLRRLGSYRGISVISPRDFLTLLKPFDLRSL